MKAKNLKDVSAKLGLSVSVLKGMQKGDKKEGSKVIANNMAKCLGNICKRAGYKNKQSAMKAIESNIRLLYMSTEEMANRVARFANKTTQHKRRQTLLKGEALLRAGQCAAFVKLISKDPSLAFFKRKTAVKIDNALLDSFRNQPKQNRATAKAMLNAIGANGERILIKESSIKSAVNKRLRRYGAVSSLFWEAAIQFNPKVRIKGVDAAKKKVKQKTRGASSRTATSNGTYSAKIMHHLEKDSPTFKNKLNKIVSDGEKYWAKLTEKEIIALLYLDKYLG